MSEPADPTQPTVLGYATPDADGLANWVGPAERLIDLRQPPRTIRQYFRRSQDATRYFAKSMSRRYPLAAAVGPCHACKREERVSPVVAYWRVRMEPKTLEFQWFGRQARSAFKTHHALCTSCQRKWQWQRWRKPMVGFMFGLFAFLIWVAMANAPNRLTMPPAIERQWPLFMFCYVILTSIVYSAMRRRSVSGLAALGLPPGLKCVGVKRLEPL